MNSASDATCALYRFDQALSFYHHFKNIVHKGLRNKVTVVIHVMKRIQYWSIVYVQNYTTIIQRTAFITLISQTKSDSMISSQSPIFFLGHF